MKKGHRGRLTAIAMGVAMLLLVLGASACSSGNDETVDLLKDPKFGLAHLNDEFHTIKGEDLLASPTFGLAQTLPWRSRPLQALSRAGRSLYQPSLAHVGTDSGGRHLLLVPSILSYGPRGCDHWSCQGTPEHKGSRHVASPRHDVSVVL